MLRGLSLLLALFVSTTSFANEEPTSPFQSLIINEQPKEAIAQAIKLLEDTQLSPADRYDGYMVLARLHHKVSDLNAAIKILKEAVTHTKRFELAEEQAQAFKLLGVMNYFKGSNVAALDAYQEALFYFKNKGHFLKQAHLLNNIALVNAALSEFEAAVTNYQQALSLYKVYGSEIDKTDVNFNIASLYNRLKRFDIAIEMLKKVINEREQRHNDFGVAQANADLGVAYEGLGKFRLARRHYLKSYNHLKKKEHYYHLASQSNNLSEVHLNMGLIQDSINFAKEGIKYAKESDNQYAYIGALYSLARANYYQGNYQQALINLEISDRISNKIDSPRQLNENLSLKALIQAALHQNAASIKTLKSYIIATNEQERKEIGDKVAQYQAKIDADQLRRQINELTQKEKLQQLTFERTQQQYQLWLGCIVFVIIIAFLIYRSHAENRQRIKLSHKVKLRTKELELLMEKLKEANTIKNQFLANMSHEIRTPLTAVIGQAEAIIAGDVDPDFLLKEVEIIFNNSNHLLTLINDILDLSRIEANKLELELQPHDIHQVVDEIDCLFSVQAKRKGLDFTVINQLPKPFVIMFDQLRLKQILINLCSNAVKFTYNGQVSLTIFVDEDKIYFAVKDTGIGLTETQMDQIFNHFTQGDSSISRRFGGSGLGLCLSKQLALMMQGNIEVSSELKSGSEFVFSLPQTQRTSQEPISLNTGIKYDQSNSMMSGLVLLADDHDDNRRLTKRLLNVIGLDVVTASNGLEAIEQFNQVQPDLILLDIEMPDMDGIQAFKILRSQGAQMPIIALTANAMRHEIDQYLALGFDNFISKPIVRADFIKTLAHYLKNNVAAEHEELIENVGIEDLIADFKDSLASERMRLSQLLIADNYQQLAIAAHRLSGAAAMFHYQELAKITGQIESVIKLGDYGQARTYTMQAIKLIDTINT